MKKRLVKNWILTVLAIYDQAYGELAAQSGTYAFVRYCNRWGRYVIGIGGMPTIKQTAESVVLSLR